MQKECNNKFFNLLPFGIMFIAIFFLHFFMNFCGDDLWFSKQLSNFSLMDYVINRYHTWSSRGVIEGLLVVLAKYNIFIWRIFDSFLYTLSAYLVVYLVDKNKTKKITILTILLFLLYPCIEMSSAGWVATTMNYSWCFAFGLLSFLPLINREYGRKSNIWIYILSIFGLIYASNQEQMCALVFGFNLLYLFYSLIYKKKIDKYNLFSLIFSVISLIIILTCPGNALRTASEITNWFPEFSKYGPLQKIYLGVVPTFGLLLENKILFTIFYIMLSIVTLLHTKNRYLKLISYFNVFFILSLTVFRTNLLNIFPNFQYAFDIFTYAGIPDIRVKYTYVPIVISIYLIISSCYMLAMSYKNERFFPLMLFIAGFMSRLIIGFSPTVFVSGPRTAFFFYMIQRGAYMNM